MFSAELDPKSLANFQQTLQRLADATDRPVEEVLRQQGRLLAKDLAFHIHPRGLAAATGKGYQETIMRQILGLYRSVGWLNEMVKEKHGEPAADFITKMIRDGKYSLARSLIEGRFNPNFPAAFIAIGPFDGGRLHKRWRWNRTRRPPIMVVVDYKEAKAYAVRTSKWAGLAKGALVHAGLQLDGKAPGIPAWVKRHTSAPGRGVIHRLKSGFTGYLESRVRYARSALPFSDELRALHVRAETAEKQLKRITDANIRKAMRGA